MYYRRTAALFLPAAGADRRDARAPTLVEWQDDMETLQVVVTELLA